MSISRRTFLGSSAIGGLAAQRALAAEIDKKTGMPTRVLGKTKARVSAVGLGCGSRLLSYGDQDKAVEAIRRALDAGINYLDSAYSYGNGKSETWVGAAIKDRRKGLWVVTKIQERNGDKGMALFEGSLKRLGVDQVDLVHVHSLTGPDDLAALEAPNGFLKTLYKIRDQKMARFIGVTSHTDPETLKTALERHDFDCTQMALNVAHAGMMNGQGGMVINPKLATSFEQLALPVALKKKMGVTAMKVFAQEKLVGGAPIETLIRYALSLPVAAAVLGMPKLEFIDENTRIAKNFKALDKREMRDLSDRLSKQYKAGLDRYFQNHVDA
jgi:aryl-alcohol dehydrogenase-like predicted oxidoreductase